MESTVNRGESCPRCGRTSLKSWKDLTANEKFHAARLTHGASLPETERRNRYFCVKCWYEKDETVDDC